MKHHPAHRLAAAGILTAGLSVLGTPLAVAPAGGAALTSVAAPAPLCQPDDLYVAKGRVEGAAGNRYLRIRLTNVGDHPCSAGLATRAGFRDWSGELGSKGLLSSGGGSITLNQGGKARTTVHWTDPGPVPEEECLAATATVVTLRVPSLRHTWRIPQHAQVCTTPAYRPDSKALH